MTVKSAMMKTDSDAYINMPEFTSKLSQNYQKPTMLQHSQLPRSKHNNYVINNPDLHSHELDHRPNYHTNLIQNQSNNSHLHRRNDMFFNQNSDSQNSLQRPSAEELVVADQNSCAKKNILMNENQHDAQIDSGNPISANPSHTSYSESFSQPSGTVQDPYTRYRDLLYINRIVFLLLVVFILTGFGTTIFIYTFMLERALPRVLTAVVSISLISVLTVWGTLRVGEYCVWRKKIRRWHETLKDDRTRTHEWESSPHENTIPVILEPPKTWSGGKCKNRDLTSGWLTEDTLREQIQRRGAGRFIFPGFHDRFQASTWDSRKANLSSRTSSMKNFCPAIPTSSRYPFSDTALYQNGNIEEGIRSPRLSPDGDTPIQPWDRQEIDASNHMPAGPVAIPNEEVKRGNSISYPRGTRILVKSID